MQIWHPVQKERPLQNQPSGTRKCPPNRLLFGAVFLALFGILTVFLFTYRRDERLFENLCSRLFREEMLSNTLNMHYTIAYPEHFDIYEYDSVLPAYSREGRLRGQAQTENLLAALKSLNPEKLPKQDRYAYDLLCGHLENSLALGETPYFEEPLSPSSGAQSQLPILLAEYAFRTEQDVRDYLKLLDQTDEYFASLLIFEQEKAQAGLLMASSSLDSVIEQCDTILDKASLKTETHFLQSTFRERILSLVSEGLLSPDQAKKYVVENNRLLRTVLQPAYEALADGLCLLQDESIPLAGLASREGGKEYYERLLAEQTGSSRSVPEIEELLLQKMSEESGQMKALLNANPELLARDYASEIEKAFPYRTAAQMLSDLQLRMKEVFPTYEGVSGAPAVAVKSVSKSLQKYCAPAFYLTPPMDDTSSNVIYINEKNAPSRLSLYTTLAHEGYPGHLYQSVFYNRCREDCAAARVRELLWYGGYLEGWALYVEFFSFDYASQLMEERGEPLLSAAIQLEKHNRSLQLCLSSLIDVMIHYENASQEQIGNFLSSFGIDNPSAVSSIYAYVAEEPANYPKYYLGYLEILDLKERARTLWQDDYSDYAFHRFFLEQGPSPFKMLQEALEN